MFRKKCIAPLNEIWSEWRFLTQLAGRLARQAGSDGALLDLREAIAGQLLAAGILAEAIDTARMEKTGPTSRYLLGVPLLSDYLEAGLDALGISVEDAEDDGQPDAAPRQHVVVQVLAVTAPVPAKRHPQGAEAGEDDPAGTRCVNGAVYRIHAGEPMLIGMRGNTGRSGIGPVRPASATPRR